MEATPTNAPASEETPREVPPSPAERKQFVAELLIRGWNDRVRGVIEQIGLAQEDLADPAIRQAALRELKVELRIALNSYRVDGKARAIIETMALPAAIVNQAAAEIARERLSTWYNAGANAPLFPGPLSEFLDQATRQQLAIEYSNKRLSVYCPMENEVREAVAVLKAHFAPESVPRLGLSPIVAAINRGDLSSVPRLIGAFSIAAEHLNNEYFHAALERAIGKGSEQDSSYTYSSPAGYHYYDGGAYQYATASNAGYQSGGGGYYQSAPRANQRMAKLVELAQIAFLPAERLERALLDGTVAALKKGQNTEASVAEMLRFLPAGNQLHAENRRYLLERALPRMFSNAASIRCAPEALRILRLHGGKLGIVPEELTDSVCIGLIRLIEWGKYSDYRQLLNSSGTLAADLNRNGLGGVISTRLSEHLSAGEIAPACDVAPLLQNVNGFQNSARRCLLTALRRGESAQSLKRLMEKFSVSPEFLRSHEARPALQDALLAAILKGSTETTYLVRKGGKREPLKRERPYAVREIVALAGLEEKHVLLAAKKAVFNRLDEGQASAAAGIAEAYGITETLVTSANFSRRLEKTLIAALSQERVETALSLTRSTLCPPKLITQPKVSAAAGQLLFTLIARGEISNALALRAAFDVDPVQFADATAAQLVRKLRTDVVGEPAKWVAGIIDAHLHFLAAHACPGLKEAAAERVVRLRAQQEAKSADILAVWFKLDYGELQQAAARLAVEMFERGEFLKGENLAAEWLLPVDALYSKMESSALQRGVEHALSYGMQPALQHLLASHAAKLDLQSPAFEDAACAGIRADVRQGDWQAVACTAEQIGITPQKFSAVVIAELEEVYTNGDLANVQNIETALDGLDRREMSRTAARALLRATAKCDIERCRKLGELMERHDPAAMNEPELRSAAVQRMARLAASGWKPRELSLITRLFALTPAEFQTAAVREAARAGILIELNEGRVPAARSLAGWCGLSEAEYGSAVVELIPRVLKQGTLAVWQVTEALGVPQDLLREPGLRQPLKERLLQAYMTGRYGEATYIEEQADLPVTVLLEIRKEALAGMIKSRRFSEASAFLARTNVSPSAAIAAILPDADPRLKDLAERCSCRSIQDLIEVGITYLEGEKAEPAGTSYAVHQAKTVFRVPDCHGYTAADGKLIDAIVSSPDTVLSRHPITLYQQQDSYTCGVAAARMAFKALTGVDHLEHTVKGWLGTTFELGTPLVLFENLRSKLPGYDVCVAAEGTREKLLAALAGGALVIVNFRLPRGGGPHYAVVGAMSDESLVLADPYYGWSALKWADFTWSGGYEEGRIFGGYVAITPPKFRALQGWSGQGALRTAPVAPPQPKAAPEHDWNEYYVDC